MAVCGVEKPWCGRDGVMVAFRFGGDPGGLGKDIKPRKGGFVGVSRWVLMQEVDGVAFPGSVSIGCGRLSLGCADIFRSEGPIVACGIVLPPGRWLLGVELSPSSFNDVRWSLPVMVRPRTAIFGSLELMDSFFSEAFLSISLLLRFVCVFIYFSCSRPISEGWIVCYNQAMGTGQLVWVCAQTLGIDQLVWVCIDGGDPAVVILPVNWCWVVGYSQAFGTDQLVWVCVDGGDPAVVILPVSSCGFVCRRTSSHSPHGFSAVCSLYYFNFFLFNCFMFPGSANPRGLLLHGFYPGCRTLCALSSIVRWRAIIKWLLPPSVRMKKKAIRPLLGYNWLHSEEIKLLNLLLCLFEGWFSSVFFGWQLLFQNR